MDYKARAASTRSLSGTPSLSGTKYARVAQILAIAVVFALLPVLTSSSYHLSTLIFVAINGIVAMSLALLIGYAGQISLGHSAFLGIGAYVSGILTATYKWPPVAGLVAAALVAAAIAFLIGLPILQMKRHYLAVATLGFGVIVYTALVELRGITGGPSGLRNIPYFSVGGFSFDSDLKAYYLVWAILIAVAVICRNIIDSRVGRALRAIRGNQVAAEAMGVDTASYKLQIFVVSAVFASLAGTLYAHYLNFLNPPPFGVHTSIVLLAMVAIGGMSSVWGAVVGAAVVTVLTDVIRVFVASVSRQASGEHEAIVFALLIMLVMMFMPNGLLPTVTAMVARLYRKLRADDITAVCNGNGIEPADSAVGGRLSNTNENRCKEIHALNGTDLALEQAGAVLVKRSAAAAADKDVVLQVNEVSKRFGGLQAVNRVTFSARKAEVIAVIGPNGAGKTTLINLITGVLRPTEGEIWFGDQRIDGRSAHRIARLGISRTFQNLRIFAGMTVLENVMVGRHARSRASMAHAAFRLPGERREEREIFDRAIERLSWVGLGTKAQQLCSSLSFGQQRLVEVARALATEPKLVLLDEPTAGLAAPEVEDLARLILRIRDEGVTVLLVEHHMELVMGISDTVVVIDGGAKIAEGTPEQVQNDRRVIDAYLGDDAD